MSKIYVFLTCLCLACAAYAYDASRNSSSFVMVSPSETSEGAWAIAANGRIYWCTHGDVGSAPNCGPGSLPSD